ncbi:condensation domain-containing protein [Paenibacillus bouchesdurhonensis]|uniref:condensation domain-containing protein n=1 Tax=Paenibacillus bouchesdurhonensis TaxID=1870990 RepID=UPI000DA6312C|nr:condensation domain-containing protein [Paenibacillus bouchesdurhonensis]
MKQSKFKVEPLDQIMYIAESGSDQQFRCYLEFDGKLEEERLRTAINLSLQLEEVLIHKLSKGFFRLAWEKLESSDIDMVFRFKLTENVERDIEQFFIQKIDTCAGPQIRIGLFRDGEKDYLGFVIHHDVSDSTGLMKYIKKLGEIYNRLNKDPAYIPNSYKKVDRSIQPLLRKYSAIERYKKMLPSSDIKIKGQIDPFPWSQQNNDRRERFLLHRISWEQLSSIYDYCQRNGCSFNDYFLTVFYKAFYTLRNQETGNQREHNPLFLTVDFRNYNRIHHENCILNFSSGILAQLDINPSDEFKKVLAEIMVFTKQVKVDLVNYGKQQVPGINTVFMLNALFKIMPFNIVQKLSNVMQRKVLGIPYLSNIGNITRAVNAWDGLRIVDAYFLGQIVYYPKFSLVLSQFEKEVTISVGFLGGDEDVEMVQRFYRLLDQNLVT